jgi:Flp pilus assembly protein TadB
MPIDWNEASTKFKIAWFSWLIGAPLLSVIIWRLQIPYVEIYLIVIAIAVITWAILYKRRKRRFKAQLEASRQEQVDGLKGGEGGGNE